METGRHDSSRLLEALLETSPEVIMLALDRDYRYLAFNERHAATVRTLWGREVALGHCMLDLFDDPAYRQRVTESCDAALSGKSFVTEDCYGDHDDPLWLRLYFSPIRADDGAVEGLIVFALDITAPKAFEQALAQREKDFRTLVEHSNDWVARHGTDLRRIYVNPAAAVDVPGGRDALIGRAPSEYPGGPAGAECERRMAEVFATGQPGEIELTWTSSDGRAMCTLLSFTPEFDGDGNVATVLAVGRDVTELNASRREIHRMAFYDALTGLPNRSLFDDRLRHSIIDAKWFGQMSGLMMLDLDRFKAINDTLGHRAGDQLLTEVARRLSATVRPYDTVSRLGGDEFTILFPNVRESDDLGRIADKLLEQFALPFHLEGTEVYVTASIGISVYPQDGLEAADLLKFADTAMYHAKNSGRNSFQFYSADLARGALDRLALEIDLRGALERSELHLHFQPQVRMATGEVTGSEALIRWFHPTRGSVPPDQFIPIAEDTGLIIPIGRWVLRKACKVATRFNGPGRPTHQVAVNVSARQLESGHFASEVAAILRETGCRPEWLEVEITERLLLGESVMATETLASLRAMGITVAIDDFGTGYSALSYLTKFPLDTLKIDRSFVVEATSKPELIALIGAVLSIAKCLGLRVVVEGVETAEQAALLCEQGCESAQGYWYARPMPAERMVELPPILPALAVDHDLTKTRMTIPESPAAVTSVV